MKKRLYEYLFVFNILTNDENIMVNSYMLFGKKKLRKKDYVKAVEVIKVEYEISVASIVNVIYIGRYKDE